MTRETQRGQVGLIVLLTMVVLLTIGVSVASRSVSETKLTRQEEETSRVFDVAETGVEQALSNVTALSGQQPSQSVGAVNLNYGVDQLNSFESRVEQGQSIDIQVAGGGGNTLAIEWAQNQTCPGAASLVVAIFSQNGGNTSVRRQTYAACNRGDNFTTAGVGAGADGYSARVSLAIAANDTLVRIKPVYSATLMRVEGVGGWLPVQSYLVTSTASNTTNNETRKITVNRSAPVAPSVFDYVVFSGGSLSK